MHTVQMRLIGINAHNIKILNNFVWGLFQYGESVFEDLQELESALDGE